MIYAAIILLLIAVLVNYFNNLRDARNGHINHTRAWKIKALTCAPSASCFAIYAGTWPGIVSSVLLVVCWFMFLFNGAWGLKVAKDPFYRSTAVGKNLAWSEKFVMHWPKLLYIIFALALCGGSLFFYIKQL